MPSLFHRHLFRDTETLADLLAGKDVDRATLYRRIFVLGHGASPNQPDHVLKTNLEAELPCLALPQPRHGTYSAVPWLHLLCHTLAALGDGPIHPGLGGAMGGRQAETGPLQVRGATVQVDPEKFLDWQEQLTRVAPLAVQVDALRRRTPPRGAEPSDLRHYVDRVLGPTFDKSTLPTSPDPVVETVVAQGGLTETHMHLMGTTELDIVWLDVIVRRRKALVELKAGSSKSEVAELYTQVDPWLSAVEFADRVRVARRIRWWLWLGATGRAEARKTKCRSALGLGEGDEGNDTTSSAAEFATWFGNGWAARARQIKFDQNFPLSQHPASEWLGKDPPPQVLEAAWLTWVLRDICARQSNQDARLLYLYLLILNANFLPLCVQQVEQVGFDQFQKITLDGAREDAEQRFEPRFYQMQYRKPADVRFVEGRFAPKDTGAKTGALLQKIVRGYWKTDGKLKAQKWPPKDDHEFDGEVRLRLVAHLIKSKDAEREREDVDRQGKPEPNKFRTHRHGLLRRKAIRQVRVLCNLREKVRWIRHYVTGLDAAANELQAPPEVFAPAYRLARSRGIRHFTYHVGEDFRHLLSGIRAVAEALDFLDLQGGDRIGHGTAVGIDPQFWLETAPVTLMLSPCEWLDNLVFAHHQLLSVPEAAPTISRLAPEIAQLSRALYGTPRDPHLLHEAWLLRRWDPLVTHVRMAGTDDEPALWWLHPAPTVHLASSRDDCGLPGDTRRDETSEEARELLQQYHSWRLRQRERELVAVQANLLSAAELRLLQVTVLTEIVKRMVAIEVPITSNVRISSYTKPEQHHVFRWLGLRGGPEPRPLLCLATDDPGIFATNLRNEFVTLHQVLRKEFGLTAVECQGMLSSLNATARGLVFAD